MDPTNQERKLKSGNNTYLAFILFISVVAVLGFIGVRLFGNDDAIIQIGESPEDFVLYTYSDEIIDTSDLEGKVLLINFWASWCDPCEEEALLLEEAWGKIGQGAFNDVHFLGIAYNDVESSSRDFLEEYGITYPNGPDLRGEISGIYNVKGVPETYILDQNGRLQFIKYGPFITSEEIVKAVEQVLENPDGE